MATPNHTCLVVISTLRARDCIEPAGGVVGPEMPPVAVPPDRSRLEVRLISTQSIARRRFAHTPWSELTFGWRVEPGRS